MLIFIPTKIYVYGGNVMKTIARKTSIVAILLVLALVFVTACRNNEDDNETVPTANEGTSETPPAGGTAPANGTNDAPATPASTVVIHEPQDMGGRTVRISSWWEGSQNFIGFGDEPDPGTAANYLTERLMWDNTRRVEREFNTSFEEVLIDFGYVLSTITSSVMAGEPVSDIAFLGGSMTLSSAVSGTILPLDEINLSSSDIFGAGIYGQIRVNELGHVWVVGPNEPYPGGMGMGVNLNIINAIGAQNPVDLYNAGQWTWENALEIMRLATRDTTGDGIIDQFGIAGQPGDFVAYIIGSNDGLLVTDDFQYGFDHPNTIEAFEFAETIFREGLWEYDRVHGFNVGDWGRNFWAAHDGNAALFTASYWTTNYGDLPFEFALVPWPTGPSNTSGNTFLAGWRQGFAFPASSDWAPADLLMVFEELTAWSGDDPGLLDESVLNMLRGRFLTEEDAQRQMNLVNTMGSCIGFVVPEYSWVLGDFVSYFLTQEQTVLQAIETHRGPRQEMLDNFFR